MARASLKITRRSMVTIALPEGGYAQFKLNGRLPVYCSRPDTPWLDSFEVKFATVRGAYIDHNARRFLTEKLPILSESLLLQRYREGRGIDLKELQRAPVITAREAREHSH